MQSNSFRGEILHEVMDKVIEEIAENIAPMLGPGASDVYIIKDGQTYFTRDGKEVICSLMFDNELANRIHHIMYQAIHNQGEHVGDGTTTLGVLYCAIYQYMRENCPVDARRPITVLRHEWEETCEVLCAALEKSSVKMTKERLLDMMVTCMQDPELAVKLYASISEPLMEGAYIVPRKSDIATDFQVTSHTRPTFAVQKMYSAFPFEPGEHENCVLLHCDGMLDIAHPDVLLALMATQFEGGTHPTYIILCNGLTEGSRRTLKDMAGYIAKNDFTAENSNNLVVLTLTDYRTFTSEETEDLSTIITGERGMGSLVHDLTWESLLYQTLYAPGMMRDLEELKTFDMDTRIIGRMNELLGTTRKVVYDTDKGIMIEGVLNPEAQARYDTLKKDIEEASGVKKVELQQRLRKTYGMFIDIEVGSTLLKDSQRKFELILDAILSASEGVRQGVLEGCSVLYLYDTVDSLLKLGGSSPRPVLVDGKNAYYWVLETLGEGLAVVIDTLYRNVGKAVDWDNIPKPDDFNLIETGTNLEIYTAEAPDGTTAVVDPAKHHIVEPTGVMEEILRNSFLPVELACTKIFHISARTGWLDNYLG